MNYSLTEQDKAEMTYYGRTLIELKAKSDVVYPGNSSDIYRLNSSFFHTDNQYCTTIEGSDNTFVSNMIRDVSAKKYFDGMYSYYQKKWLSLN